jgi:hypothetical protein
MSNKLLHAQSAAKYKHLMKVKVKYYYLGTWKVDDGEIEIIPFVHTVESLVCH